MGDVIAYPQKLEFCNTIFFVWVCVYEGRVRTVAVQSVTLGHVSMSTVEQIVAICECMVLGRVRLVTFL